MNKKPALFACALALIGMHAFAVYLLPVLSPASWHFLKRTWGFHFLTFYPSYVAVCAYAVAVAVTVPQINFIVAKHIETIARRVTTNKAFLWGGLCLVFVVAFYLAKQKYAFLGDGYLRPAEVINEFYPRQGKGVMFVLMQLQKWMGQWDKTGVFAFQVFSIFCGVPYIVLVCAWSNLIGKLPHEKVFCFMLMVFIGSFQFFFGYIETYAPLPSFILAFILCGMLALRQNKLPAWSTAFFAAGVIMHVLLLFLTPALLFLWWWSFSRKYPIFRDRKFIAFGVAVAVVLACTFAYIKSGVLLSLFPSAKYPYGIFTLWHVWEYLNAQILSAPVAFPLLLLSVFAVRIIGRETAFLLFCAVGAFLSLSVVDVVLGSIDWDVLALSGVPLMALSTYTLQQIKNKPVKQYTSLFSCVCAGLLIVPFIHINHTDRSISRVIQIIKNDQGSYYYNLTSDLMLAMSFKSAGLDSFASVYFEKAWQKNPHDRRNAFNMGIVLFRNDKYLESIPYFLSTLDLSPNYEKALDALLWLTLHFPDLAVESIEKHLPKSKHNDFWIRLALRGMKTGKVQLVHDLSPEIVLAISRKAHFYITQRDTNRAANLLKHALLGNIQIK